MFKAGGSELTLRQEYADLKRELASISAVEEFAKYARTQRRLNKVEEQLMSAGQNRLEGRESARWKLTKPIQAVNVGLGLSPQNDHKLNLSFL